MKDTKKIYKFIISGGGTGGHIFPAVSIAHEIKRKWPDAKILFIGAEGRMETVKVPQAGYEIKTIPIAGLQRKWSLKNLLLPFKVIKSLLKTRKILKAFQPDAVIGTGGYVSLPVLWMAQQMKIPTFIQEQNSYPGITNKLLEKKAVKIFTAYPEAQKYFPDEKVVMSGNPVRPFHITSDKERKNLFEKANWDENKPVVLVLGGSLGSAAINRAIEKMIITHPDLPFNLYWQTGKNYFEKYKHHAREGVYIVPFIEKMDLAYGVSDLIISRAGAGTLSELAVVAKPAILIPSPNVAEDHQTKNAQSFTKHKAAVLLPETRLENLYEKIDEMISNKDMLESMRENLKKIAKPNAVQTIVEEIARNLKDT